MKKKQSSPYTTAYIGALIILVGVIFLFYNYFVAQKISAYDYMSNAFYNEKTETIENLTVEIKEEEEEEVEELPPEITDEYIGYLIIPKINLTKGFLDYRSEYNNVDQNIMVINGSNYPTKKNGNMIIAGHSGTGWNSFFNDLYELQLEDEAIIDYKNKKYHYLVKNIYTQSKNGRIIVYRDYHKTTLTLITCTNNDSTTQTVYILELDMTEE